MWGYSLHVKCWQTVSSSLRCSPSYLSRLILSTQERRKQLLWQTGKRRCHCSGTEPVCVEWFTVQQNKQTAGRWLDMPALLLPLMWEMHRSLPEYLDVACSSWKKLTHKDYSRDFFLMWNLSFMLCDHIREKLNISIFTIFFRGKQHLLRVA